MTGRSLRALLLAAQLAPAVAGCGAGASGAVADVVEIEASDRFAFSPAQITVVAGTTVRWINKGAVPHTVTSGASSRASDDPGAVFDHKLPSGGSVEVRFDTAGDQPYFCRYHEGMGMIGMVTVTANR
jgi:plastocyanin